MHTYTPKTAKIPSELLQLKTPEEPTQLPWDPRSPLGNRTPINLIEPTHSPITGPIIVNNSNPLDPRSPLLDGNRTPIPADGRKEKGKKKKGGKKGGGGVRVGEGGVRVGGGGGVRVGGLGVRVGGGVLARAQSPPGVGLGEYNKGQPMKKEVAKQQQGQPMKKEVAIMQQQGQENRKLDTKRQIAFNPKKNVTRRQKSLV